MTASTGITGYVRDQARPALDAVGGFTRMCVLTGKALMRPFRGKCHDLRIGCVRGRSLCRLGSWLARCF
jgi:hypothetical protein